MSRISIILNIVNSILEFTNSRYSLIKSTVKFIYLFQRPKVGKHIKLCEYEQQRRGEHSKNDNLDKQTFIMADGNSALIETTQPQLGS